MNYLLDTNICIHYFKGDKKVSDRIQNTGFDNVAISEITLAELYFGAEKSQRKESNLKVIETFSKKIAIIPIYGALRIYGSEKARLRQKGTIISDLDLLIGASAIAGNLIMVTRNVGEFERMKGIKIENWIDE